MKTRFTEQMSGFYFAGAPDYTSGEIDGRREGFRWSFRLTLKTDDVRKLVRDLEHPMAATGTVLIKEFSPVPLEIIGGRFQVFAPGEHGRYAMRYRLPFDVEGRRMTLLAFKDVGDDYGIDFWKDTTTLYGRIVDGDADWDNPNYENDWARGILRLSPFAFLKQLLTFRGDPLGIGLFGLFFLLHLLAAYSGPRHRHRDNRL